ncbi:hypothetical protein GGG16DRAFT_44021 [Schizophyllum commune]
MNQNPDYLLDTTQSVRDHVCSYIADIPVVDLKVFLNHYMPQRMVPYSPTVIARALSEGWRFPTRSYESQEYRTNAPLDVVNSRWTQFMVDPKDQHKREAAVYSVFEGIFNQVVACCLELHPELKRTTTKYFNEGDRQAQSTKTSRSRRDADIRLRWPSNSFGDGELLYTHAVTIQLKKAEKDRMKLCWELIHILRSEPGRRFALGMSVENNDVRLWHFNREIVVVSELFDFQKNHEYFIDVLARFAFAPTPQLGYDPTFIKGALVGGKRLPDRIIINDTTYELLRVLENHRANAAIGRCSWIWEAKAIGTEKIVVIKDCWMEDDRQTEFEILVYIRKLIQAFDWKQNCAPPPKDGQGGQPLDDSRPIDPHYHDDVNRAAYFTNITHGERVKVDGRIDNTRTVMARGHHLILSGPSSCEWFRITPQTGSRQNTGHMSGTSGHESQDEFAPVKGIFSGGTNARSHHRLIMSRGQPLDKITDPANAFRVLKDASYGLFVMHCVGYMHRDPSAPNILRSEEGLGVLSDLEYAKRLSDETPAHVGRTGTPNYVAFEVILGQYLMAPTAVNQNPKAFFVPSISANQRIPRTLASNRTSTLIPWRMCELHDIESMFWIALWIFFRHTLSRYLAPRSSTIAPSTGAGPAASAPSNNYSVEEHRAMYHKIFPGKWNEHATRQNILMWEHEFIDAVAKLPSEFQDRALDFDLLRSALLAHYSEPGKRTVHGGLWHMLYVLCDNTMQVMPTEDKLVSVSSVPLPAEKRRAEDDAKDPADSGRGRAEGPMKLLRTNA